MATLIDAVRVLGVGPARRAGRIRRYSQELLRGFYTTRAIIALFNVGLLDEMEQKGSVNLQEFSTRNNLDLNTLTILCDYLYSLKIMRRQGESYALDTQHDYITGVLRGPFYSVYAYQDIFHNLEALLRKEKLFGVDVMRQGEYVARGSGAVGQLLAFPMMADVLKRNNYTHIADLCCGDATFLMDMCQRNPQLHGDGVDLSPEAIAYAATQVEKRRLDGRIKLFTGDVFKIDELAEQLTGIQAATCVYALHEFYSGGPEQLIDFLRRFKSSFPGVPLIICEVIGHTPEQLRGHPGGVLEIQLWHRLSNQQLLSRNQWKGLFRKAGFANIQEDYWPFAKTAIFTIS